MSTLNALPDYALQFAPIMWLNSTERYWPGNIADHLQHCTPLNRDGTRLDVPADLVGKIGQLKLPNVNQTDVFLTLNDSVTTDLNLEVLTSTRGKPDPTTGQSTSICWIIQVDKSGLVAPGTVDIFYFFFYPYNLGPNVVGSPFGNHVGDWEHAMIRFQNGQPIAMHLSAHSVGHSWAWQTMEKSGQRPVGYTAIGTHANYGKPGDKFYTPATILGPIDHANKGVRWDPTLNYCAASYDLASETFTALGPPLANTPSSIISNAARMARTLTGQATPQPSYNQTLTPDDIVAILTYKGQWGNSFSQFRQPDRPLTPDPFQDISILFGNAQEKLEGLVWAEGPSGPRWKSLDRPGMTYGTKDLLPALV